MNSSLEGIKNKFDQVERSRAEFEQQELTQLAIDLLDGLGYSSDHVFLNILLEPPQSVRRHLGVYTVGVDALVAESVTSPPHIVVNTSKVGRRDEFVETPGGMEVLSPGIQSLLADTAYVADAGLTLIATNYGLALHDQSEHKLLYDPMAGSEIEYEIFSYADTTESQLERIKEYLSPPNQLPTGRRTNFPAAHHPHQTRLTRWILGDSDFSPDYYSSIQDEFFELDIDRYTRLLYDAYNAVESTEKGDKLEEVAEYLFEGFAMLSIRDTNLRTRTGEIDLVLEYTGLDSVNLFEYYSRFIPVECKNTKEPVSTEQIGYFRDKLSRRDLTLGLFISWSGVTGEESGRYGEEIAKWQSKEKPTVVVLTSRDLYRVLDGTSLYDIIDEKLYQSRFGV